jgi:amino acid transporter
MIVASIIAAVSFYVIVTLAVGFSGLGDDSLGAASAAARLWQSPTAGVAVVIAGIAGIITSWNAFLIGGSRAMFALAEAGDLPRCFAALHPRFRTPWVAVLTIGGLSVFAPMLGRNALIWIVNAGGLGVVISYGLVAAAFIALRRKEPNLPRPYLVPAGKWVGTVGVVLTGAMALLYLPGSPSALQWPQEWALLIGWCALGTVLWLASLRSGPDHVLRDAPRDRYIGP